jgi:hypothetical protein
LFITLNLYCRITDEFAAVIAAALQQVCGAHAVVLRNRVWLCKLFLQAPLNFQFLDDDFDIHMGCNSTRLALQRGSSPAE